MIIQIMISTYCLKTVFFTFEWFVLFWITYAISITAFIKFKLDWYILVNAKPSSKSNMVDFEHFPLVKIRNLHEIIEQTMKYSTYLSVELKNFTHITVFPPNFSTSETTAGHATKPLTLPKQRSPTAGRGLMRTIFFVDFKWVFVIFLLVECVCFGGCCWTVHALFDVIVSVGRSFRCEPNRWLRSSRGASAGVDWAVTFLLAECLWFDGCCWIEHAFLDELVSVERFFCCEPILWLRSTRGASAVAIWTARFVAGWFSFPMLHWPNVMGISTELLQVGSRLFSPTHNRLGEGEFDEAICTPLVFWRCSFWFWSSKSTIKWAGILQVGSHVFPSSSYPSHLIKYWI